MVLLSPFLALKKSLEIAFRSESGLVVVFISFQRSSFYKRKFPILFNFSFSKVISIYYSIEVYYIVVLVLYMELWLYHELFTNKLLV